MPRQAPYLQRRGDTFFFFFSVPPDIRPHIGWREITKTLRTTQRVRAIPMALEYAAKIKRVFLELRAEMGESNDDRLLNLIWRKRLALKSDELCEKHEDELIQRNLEHSRKLKQVRLEAENDTMRRVLAGFSSSPVGTHNHVQENALAAQETGSVPTLKVVVDSFLGK